MSLKSVVRRCAIVIPTSLVLWAAEALAAGPHTGPISVNWWAWKMDEPPVGWFAVNFVLFVALMVRVTKKPLKKAMVERHHAIKNAIEENQAKQKAAELRRAEAEESRAKIAEESARIDKNAQEQAADESARIIDGAKAYAERVRKDSESILDQELARSTKKLQAESVKLALHRAEELLLGNMTDTDRQRLLEEAIASLEEGQSPAARNTSSSHSAQERALGGAA